VSFANPETGEQRWPESFRLYIKPNARFAASGFPTGFGGKIPPRRD